MAKKFHIQNQRWLQFGEIGLERSSFMRAVSAGEFSSPGARKKANTISRPQRPAYERLKLSVGVGSGVEVDERREVGVGENVVPGECLGLVRRKG